MIKGTAMTDFKQFDLNTINIRLQHVTFDILGRVSKKLFKIDKADVSHFLGESKYMFDLICSHQLLLQWRLWHDGDADGFCRQQ